MTINTNAGVPIVTTESIKAVEIATGHSVYGGSSLPKIVDCPASVGQELASPLQPESPYAAAGTRLHNIMEIAMKAPDPEAHILSLDISIEESVLCLDAKDYVQGIIDLHPDGRYTIEHEAKGDLSSYGLPEVYGTMDVVIKSAHRVDVIDYKFGYGVSVYAEENYQLVSYLGMAVPYVDMPDDVELHVHICQPPKHIYSDWRLDHQKMYQMLIGDVTDAIAESRTESPRFGPTVKACRFCRANMRCKARHNSLRENARMIQQMSQNPSQVTNEQWAEFLEGWEALKSAAKQVEKFAVTEIMSGNEFPMYKLVQGKSNRKFKDDEAGKKYIMEVLGDKAYAVKERPIISLAQAEKLHKDLKQDEFWKDLVYKPEGAPKLVKADAKGKAMTFGTRSIMDDIASGVV